MKKKIYLLVIMAAFALAHSTQADVVMLTPGDINNGDTTTAVFDDGSLQLMPLIGNTPTTFNAAADRLGVDGNGTNPNAFNDIDTDPNNDNDERLVFSFSATAALSQIGWDFSRADGVGGGVSISGFVSDPLATFSGQAAGYTSTYDSITGTLNFEVPVTAFVNDDGFLNLGNLSASLGQTLTLSVADIDQAGSQLAITTISYGVVPEPTSFLVFASCCVASLVKRTR